MELRCVYRQEEGMWLGFWGESPDYRPHAESEAELRENLRDIYEELNGGKIPNVRRVAEIDVA